MKQCDSFWLGEVPYTQAWELQAHIAGKVAAKQRPPTLLLLEHPHTYTFGSRGQAANLLWDGEELARRGVSVHWIDRGGDVTYHGPGQLVGYPLIPLGPPKRQTTNGIRQEGSFRIPEGDYTGYLRHLETVIIKVLNELGVVGERIPGMTGIWTMPPGTERPAKIAAFGVKVDRFGVTRHGFALNIRPDMTYFDGIIACGLVGHPVTSLAEHLESPPSASTLAERTAEAFGEVFGFTINFRSGPAETESPESDH